MQPCRRAAHDRRRTAGGRRGGPRPTSPETWVPSLRERMYSIMRWRSGLIASVIIGKSCLRSGSRHLDLQDRMTHTLLTISPRVEPYRCPPRPPPRAIAQRFSALTHLRHGLHLAFGARRRLDVQNELAT